MKTIPRRLLRNELSVETFAGQSGVGPKLDAAVNLYGNVQMNRQMVRDADGSEVVSEMTVHVHPDDAAYYVPGTLITTAFGYTGRVLAVAPQGRPGETVLIKVVCT